MQLLAEDIYIVTSCRATLQTLERQEAKTFAVQEGVPTLRLVPLCHGTFWRYHFRHDQCCQVRLTTVQLLPLPFSPSIGESSQQWLLTSS